MTKSTIRLLALLVFYNLVDIRLSVAQEQSFLDSCLYNVENATNDREKIEAIEFLAERFCSTYPDTVIHFAKKGAYLAVKLNDKKRQGRFIHNIGVAHTYLSEYSDALEYFLNASEMSVELKDTSSLSITYTMIGHVYRYIGNLDSAELFYDRAISFKSLAQDTVALSHYYNNIGIVNMMRSNYDIGMEQWARSLELKLALGDSNGAAITMGNMAMYYRDIGNTEKALSYFLSAARIHKNTKDYEGEGLVYDNLGELYMMTDEPKLGEVYYKKALRIFKRIHSKDRVSRTYRNMAKFLNLHEDFARAYLYLDSHLVINQEVINESILKDMDVIKSRHAAENSALKVKNLQIENELKDEHSKQQELVRYGLMGILLLLVVFALFIVWKFIQKKKDNAIISAQKSLVEEQKVQVEFQKNILHEKNMEITDSITYAKRLQNAMLPDLGEFRALFENGFLLYLPKDIVAGDFYWTQNVDGYSFFAVADCTGHGVPGALVSVVCSNALNRAVKEFGCIDPHEVLDKTSELVEGTFRSNEEEVMDGMDIALCCFNHKTKELFYAGANNDLYLISKNEISIYKAAKRPVGAFSYQSEFVTHKIDYQEGDRIYLFSDGYADQFGGERGKKFKYSNFRKLLLDNSELDMNDQKDLLQETIIKWRGELEQIDDICVMGIQL